MVMCGDIHKRGVLNFKQIKDIDIGELSKYEKMGWEVDND